MSPSHARRGALGRPGAALAAAAAAALAITGLGSDALAAGASDGPADGPTAQRPDGPADGSAAEPAGLPLKAGNYVVTLAAPPLATYDGGIASLAPTRPKPGTHLERTDPDVRDYRSHLLSQQRRLLNQVGAEATYQYTVASNGFAARLTGAQAAKLAGAKGVLSVVPDEARTLDTTVTPGLLGLSGPGGVWADLGSAATAGRGTVVGVLDSGYTPENPFFAGEAVTRQNGPYAVPYRSSAGEIVMKKGDGQRFIGSCQSGERYPATTCNSKVLSARYFPDGYLLNVPESERSPHELISPRDGDGHGSHTASTAAGNRIASLTIDGHDYGPASGMAPGAKLAIYKVCWAMAAEEEPTACYTSDSLRAIDQAVLDGVDVINYSISGATDTVDDPVEIAFLAAAAAGVFVTTSAGNSGPEPSTVAHNSPWVTTVAATSAHRFEGTLELGDGTRLRGASFAQTGVPASPAIHARDAAASPGDPAAELCAPDSLNPQLVAGKVVICDRGQVARVAKSAEVARAGGIGMVLANLTPPTRYHELSADQHSVPSVHVDRNARARILDYLEDDPTPTIRLLVGDQTGGKATPVPVVADFSSRGPAIANGGDVLKPDVAAPGVDILAATAPAPHGGEQFAPSSGTSMSSPHVAGLGALFLTRFPKWSPAAVRSALMTSAVDTKYIDGADNTDPFDQGAGFVNPRRFLRPGLVFDAGPRDWLGFLEGVGVDTGSGVPAIDPSDLNQASIAIGQLAGEQTVVRRVTSAARGTWRPQASMPGVKVTVSPAKLYFRAKGQTKSFKVTFRRTTAELGEFTTGRLTWSDGNNRRVRVPLAVQPVTVAAPAEVSGSGASGSIRYQVVPGANGPIDLSVRGLAAGQVHRRTLPPGELLLAPRGNTATAVYRLSAPAGTTLARADLVAGNQADDLDLYLVNEDFDTVVDYSATGAASERVDLIDPDAGTYYVLVHAFSTESGGPAPFTLRLFAVGDSPTGDLTLSPDPLDGVAARPAQLTARWSGLDPARPYLGWVGYSGSAARTIVAVN